MNTRQKLGFEDDEDIATPPVPKPPVLDLSDFQPKQVTRPDQAKVAEAAAKAQFKRREAKDPVALTVPAPVPAKATRRRRTGRSAQLNLKCRPETIEQFYAIADANGWVLGEAFEKAVELLQQKAGKPV
ncbi:stability/partitioning determinant (plasmid) [Peteryoungia desertarenae]|uniref:Stability/partitioning determinant n=1 Tax=Peteryoungia desertarenae TaxID=1813451 RepID=A0ABX6QTU9_9HYPH|nr:stability/partitioning determinant [Peteryoungia desertarenae]QLF72053.1 stability/partitioning determinant [Peteryoungia desertarenae]